MADNIQIKVPVLLIAFNRPESARMVFDAIRKAKPSHFYLAVDGARPDRVGEADLCKQCQDIAKLVDWDCEVHTLFRDRNVGCGLGPSGAISWAFETAEQLIILEDDCLPSQSFFSYCQELLDKYKNEKRVWIISGLSIHPDTSFFEGYDYLFSKYAHTWGWATWKDRWEQFDIRMTDAKTFVDYYGPEKILGSNYEAKRWRKKLLSVYKNIEDEVKHSWDTQWDYARMKNNSCDIVPCKNLIMNIGSDNGTHISVGGTGGGRKVSEINHKLVHPPFVICNREYDDFHYKNHIHPSKYKLILSCLKSRKRLAYLLSILKKKIRL